MELTKNYGTIQSMLKGGLTMTDVFESFLHEMNEIEGEYIHGVQTDGDEEIPSIYFNDYEGRSWGIDFDYFEGQGIITISSRKISEEEYKNNKEVKSIKAAYNYLKTKIDN